MSMKPAIFRIASIAALAMAMAAVSSNAAAADCAMATASADCPAVCTCCEPSGGEDQPVAAGDREIGRTISPRDRTTGPCVCPTSAPEAEQRSSDPARPARPDVETLASAPRTRHVATQHRLPRRFERSRGSGASTETLLTTRLLI